MSQHRRTPSSLLCEPQISLEFSLYQHFKRVHTLYCVALIVTMHTFILESFLKTFTSYSVARCIIWLIQWNCRLGEINHYLLILFMLAFITNVLLHTCDPPVTLEYHQTVKPCSQSSASSPLVWGFKSPIPKH